MIIKPDSCKGCALEHLGKGFMRVDGKGKLGILVVAEALGKNEAVKGVPLIGPAGLYLHKTLEKVGLHLREDFWMANCVWCQPPEDKLQGMPYKYAAIQHCEPNLDGAIRELKPKVIVTLGDIALERLTNMTGIMDCRGYPQWNDQFGCWIVPTLHPSFIMRGNHKWALVMRGDFTKAVQIASEGYEYEDMEGGLDDPLPEGFMEWVERFERALVQDPTTRLAFDIETPYKRGKEEDELDDADPSYVILRCSFAFGDNVADACSIPWETQYMGGVERLFNSCATKLVWNGHYDVPRIEAAGITIKGEIRDSQVAWHVSNSDLRKKLGFVATLCPLTHRVPMWKHLSGQRPAYYNRLDSTVTHRIDTWVMESLEKQGMIHIYQEQVRDVDRVTKVMTEHGIGFDVEEAEKLHLQAVALQERLLEEINAAVPEEVKPKKIYKKEREGTTAISATVQVKVCSACGKERVSKVHPCIKQSLGEIIYTPKEVTVWQKTLPFLPSTQQLVKYAEFMGYEVPKSRKTKNATMDEAAVDRLLRKHPTDVVLGTNGKYKEVQKADGTYIRGVPVGVDRRVHGTIGHMPSTLRTSMWSPNLQNIPRPGESGEEDFYTKIRSLYIAEEGNVLGARDYSGIEAVLVGYEMKDPIYIRLARLGVHAYLCSHLVGKAADLKWSDADLKECFAEMKKYFKPMYLTAKKTVHLSNYAGTPFKMWEAEPTVYASSKDAEKYQKIYYEVAPKLPVWHLETCERAEKMGYVRAPDGFVHRFHNLFRYEYVKGVGWTKFNKQGKVMWGEDAKRAIAFVPQHMAAVKMKEALVEIGGTDLIQYLLLTIHDELFWECAAELQQEVDARIAAIMEKPCRHLPMPESWGLGTHLWVGTEGKCGPNWGGMK